MFPIHMNLGFFHQPFYEGLYFALSILLGIVLATRAMKKRGLDAEMFNASLLWILGGALVGARLAHFIFWNPALLLSNPGVFFNFVGGGFSITGGLAGGFLAGAIYFALKKANFWVYFAVASPVILLSQAVGRVGCFLNGDAWGQPTNLPWGLSFPRYGMDIPSFEIVRDYDSMAWSWAHKMNLVSDTSTATVPLHPTQLYEALGDLALMGIVLLLVAQAFKTGRNFSKVFMVHTGGYSLLRFALEFVHGDKDVTVWLGMTSLQISLLVLGLVCAVLYFVVKDEVDLSKLGKAVPAAAGAKGKAKK